jgi:hypothetical protein
MTLHAPRISTRIAGVSVALALTAGVGVAAVVAPSSASPVGDAHALNRTVVGPNLITNSGFANGFQGWSRSKQNAGALRISSGGVWGSRQAAAMQPRKQGAAVLRDARSSAPRAVNGMQYQASAWVKASGSPVRGVFRLYEWKSGAVVARQGTAFTALESRWRRVTIVARAQEDGSALQLSLAAFRIGSGHGLKIDRIRLHPVKGSSGPTASSSPTAEPSASSDPSPEPSPATSSSSPSPSAPEVSGDTLFGASVYEGTRTWSAAVAESNATYGGMEVVRVFYPGLPSAWPGRAGQVGGPVVVSFKANPVDIVSGKDDEYLSKWFATAPRDRDIWWTYWHEPEDDVERGGFTAQQWRDAYRHLAGLAEAAENPRLHNTVILMCWTVNLRSGRSFEAFFPGRDVVDAMGWDCYSVASSTTPYAKPEDIYGRALAKTRELGLQFGVAETGSLLAPGDPDGTKRAAWLGSVGRWLQGQDATFVCYFDSVVGGEFRLLDEASQQAWRQVVTGIGVHTPI